MILQLLPLTLLLAAVPLLIWLLFKIKAAQHQHGGKPTLTVILGSGGHTTEMCQLLRDFNFEECQQINVISGASDKLSESFFVTFLGDKNSKNIRFIKTMRTNEVLQSKITSVATTLRASLHALFIIYTKLLNSSQLVANGPGLAIPYFFFFFLLNKVRVTGVKLIFIESWCRVKSLSLAGKIAQHLADEYIVHWPEQQQLSKKAKYYGKLI